MYDNTPPLNEQTPELPSHEQLITRITALLPFTRPANFRSRVVEAIYSLLPIVKEEAALALERRSTSPEEHAAQIRHILEHYYYKSLVQSTDPNDESTSLGYLRVKHGFTHYKTNPPLRQALLNHGIPIQPPLTVRLDLRTKETIDLPESVLTKDLDRFVQLFREKETTRQRAFYDRRKSEG
jgi:hypothetical protein